MGDTVRRGPFLTLPARASARPRTAPAVLASVLLAFAAGACESESPFDSAIRSDSAGILLVQYPELPPVEESRIAIAAEPDLVLGEGALAGPDYEFFEISGGSQLRDGTLVVANNGSHELRFYDADGHFLHSGGREGDGPGEFRSMSDLWITAGDTLVVWDGRTRRLQHFSPDGAFVRVASMMTTPFVEFSGRPQAEALLENGRVVVLIESPPRPTEGAERLPLLVALHQIGDGGWDSVRVVPGTERILRPFGDDGFSLPGYAFPANTLAAGAGRTMAVADGARFHVELFDPTGRLVSILSASVPEVPVTSDVLDAFIEHMVHHAPRWARTGAGADEYVERLRREVPTSHAPFLPVIRDVFVDADERIWVERYDVPESGPSRWEVFARDGSWVGRVEMPEGFARGASVGLAPGFSVRSGRLAGVWTDPDTGVETVRVYRLIEPDS